MYLRSSIDSEIVNPWDLTEGIICFKLGAVWGILDIEHAFFVYRIRFIVFTAVPKQCRTEKFITLKEAHSYADFFFFLNYYFLVKHDVDHFVLHVTLTKVNLLLGKAVCADSYFVHTTEIRLCVTSNVIHAEPCKFYFLPRKEADCIIGLFISNVTQLSFRCIYLLKALEYLGSVFASFQAQNSLSFLRN